MCKWSVCDQVKQ